MKVAVGDMQIVAAISGEFMAHPRYKAWYDENLDTMGGTPQIWMELGLTGIEIALCAERLKVDWNNYNLMDAVDSIVKVMFEGGFYQCWTDVLSRILQEQKTM